MSTLTYLGIVWQVGSYNGRACYTYGGTSITFHPSVGEYAVWSGKLEYFSSPNVADCLEMATEVILDMLSAQFTTSWETEEVAPITERTPMCEEVCHAAE